MAEPRAMLPSLAAQKSPHGQWDYTAEAGTGMSATGKRPVEALAWFCEILGLPRARSTIAETGPDHGVRPPRRL